MEKKKEKGEKRRGKKTIRMEKIDDYVQVS